MERAGSSPAPRTPVTAGGSSPVEILVPCTEEQRVCPQIEKGLASDRIVIDTVVRKYCDHVPLYRPECDSGARHRTGTQPRDAGWLGSPSR